SHQFIWPPKAHVNAQIWRYPSGFQARHKRLWRLKRTRTWTRFRELLPQGKQRASGCITRLGVKLIPDPFPLRASLGISRCLRLAFFLPSVPAICALGAFRVSLKKSSAQLHGRAGRVGDQKGPAPEEIAQLGAIGRVHFHVPKAG